MTMGRVWDGAPLSHSHPKIYSYSSSLPKSRVGRGMHFPILKQQLKSHPHPVLTPVCVFEEMRLGIEEIKY